MAYEWKHTVFQRSRVLRTEGMVFILRPVPLRPWALYQIICFQGRWIYCRKQSDLNYCRNQSDYQLKTMTSAREGSGQMFKKYNMYIKLWVFKVSEFIFNISLTLRWKLWLWKLGERQDNILKKYTLFIWNIGRPKSLNYYRSFIYHFMCICK